MLWRLFGKLIDRKAKRNVARKNGISYQYVHEVIENNRRYIEGRISRGEWVRRGMAIAYRYPKDAGLS